MAASINVAASYTTSGHTTFAADNGTRQALLGSFAGSEFLRVSK